jgi:hypothetical protein
LPKDPCRHDAISGSRYDHQEGAMKILMVALLIAILVIVARSSRGEK